MEPAVLVAAGRENLRRKGSAGHVVIINGDPASGHDYVNPLTMIL
jgi:hypothetical protein